MKHGPSPGDIVDETMISGLHLIGQKTGIHLGLAMTAKRVVESNFGMSSGTYMVAGVNPRNGTQIGDCPPHYIEESIPHRSTQEHS